MENAEVEETVDRILAGVPEYIWNGEKLPVPVDEIVSNVYGLRVRIVDDMSKAPGCPEIPDGSTISGLLLTGLGEIWVNASEAERWDTRRRFTVGHELGHYVMHQESKARVFCRSDAIAEDEKSQAAVKDPIEVQADAFAAAMLMPMHLVRAELLAHGRDIDRLCETFSSSHKAMNYRLDALASG